MHGQTRSRRLVRFERFAQIAGVAVAAIGLLALAGWAFDVGALRSGVPGLTAMNPGGTAPALVLAGAALWLLSRPPANHGRRNVGRALAAGVALIAASRLAGYLAGWDGGPDQWLFHEMLQLEAERLGYASRSAPNTAAALFAVGLSLLLLDVCLRRLRPAEILALLEALDRVGGDRVLLRDLAATFVDQCPTWLADVRSAVDRGDADALRAAAHPLKSSLELFGATSAADAAGRLESLARTGKLDGGRSALDDLDRTLARVVPVLRALDGRAEPDATATDSPTEDHCHVQDPHRR